MRLPQRYGHAIALSARLNVIALAGVLMSANPTFAATIVDTASGWGLFGTWRLDCTKPPSRNDPDLNFVVKGGKLFHDRNWGDGKDSSAVMSATLTATGGIDLVVKFDSLSQTREWVYARGSDGRIEAISNRNVDTDQYTIRDGKFTANGNSPPGKRAAANGAAYIRR